MSINISDSDKMMYLGVLLKITGLTLLDVQKIINNELILDDKVTPSEVRNFILDDSQNKVALLRKMSNLGILLSDFSEYFNFNVLEVERNIDNLFYYVNTVDFKMRSNSNLRNQMIDFLKNSKINSRQISEILDIGYSTVRNYLRG
ncbi:hypothetical protein ACQ9ZF_12390 (plasmid) [Cetobacterium somerae]|uniref:hypothetical protein n=1 Tax=Cetobacterium somerae TaxID=188913 RepID=UPI003D768A6A